MLYDSFNKKPTEEINNIFSEKKNLVLHDYTDYPNLEQLFEHIPQENILSVSIDLNTEDLWRFTEFIIVFKLVNDCSILILSHCCINIYAKLEAFVLNIMNPLKQIQEKVTLEGTTWDNDKQLIKKALEVAKADKADQFPTFEDDEGDDESDKKTKTDKMSVLDEETIDLILNKTRKN